MVATLSDPLFELNETSSFKGDKTEYKAILWLLENNFKVFKNCECTGPIDLIAVSATGEIKLIDVKTNYKPMKRTPLQHQLNVNFLRPSATGGFHFTKHTKHHKQGNIKYYA